MWRQRRVLRLSISPSFCRIWLWSSCFCVGEVAERNRGRISSLWRARVCCSPTSFFFFNTMSKLSAGERCLVQMQQFWGGFSFQQYMKPSFCGQEGLSPGFKGYFWSSMHYLGQCGADRRLLTQQAQGPALTRASHVLAVVKQMIS